MSVLETLFNVAFNTVRGSVGSFGSLVFEVYSGGLGFGYDLETKELKARKQTRVLTPHEYRRRTRARYAKHEILNAKTQLEKVGDESEQISLAIKLVRELGVDIEEELATIRTYIKDGHADFLIIGREVVGAFVISELDEEKIYVNALGQTQVAELKLTLEEVQADDIRTEPEPYDLEGLILN